MKYFLIHYNFDAVNAFVEREQERAMSLLRDAHARRWRLWGDVALRFGLAFAFVLIGIGALLWLISRPSVLNSPVGSQLLKILPGHSSSQSGDGYVPPPLAKADASPTPDQYRALGAADEAPPGTTGSPASGNGLEAATSSAGARSPEIAETIRLLTESQRRLQEEAIARDREIRELGQVNEVLRTTLKTATTDNGQLATQLTTRESELAGLRATSDALRTSLQPEIETGGVEVEQNVQGIRVNLPEAVLFEQGSADLDQSGKDVLIRVAAEFARSDHLIVVEGHSDNVPIGGTLQKTFPTNWELAGARASRVVRLLEQAGIRASRMEAVSRGDTQPVVPNTSKDNRARNRRIEIKLVPRSS